MGVSNIRTCNKIEPKILNTVRQTIARHGMFAAGDSVLIAVSGGPDSVALAHLLMSLAAEYPLQLAVAHLNHGLRGPESDRDADFVASLARNFALPLFLEKKDVHRLQQDQRLSPEEAARQVRYAFYDAVATKNRYTKIALGHHSDDNAELVLMNLLRGSGPLGLSGIAPVRDKKIVRPMIRLSRSEILKYLSEKNIPFVTDSSNSDPAFRRNKIRHHLIPELKKTYNPAIVDSLNRLGEIMQAEDQWIDDTLRPYFSDCVLNHVSNKRISLALSRISQMGPAVGRRIIRKAVFSIKGNLRRISLRHVDAVLELAQKPETGGSLYLPEGLRVTKDAAALTIYREGEDPPPDVIDYRYTIAGQGTTVIKEVKRAIRLVEIETDKMPHVNESGHTRAFFDLDCLRFPLVVRNFRPGDRFSPLGLDGTQKLKKYFNNQKIPADQRRTCPLLLSEGKIIWVAGHRIDNRAKIKTRTERVLMAELLLAY